MLVIFIQLYYKIVDLTFKYYDGSIQYIMKKLIKIRCLHNIVVILVLFLPFYVFFSADTALSSPQQIDKVEIPTKNLLILTRLKNQLIRF